MTPDDPERREQRTLFQPGRAEPPSPAAAPPPPSVTAAPIESAALRSGARIEGGDVLNHIFQVKRFIARGGMGEVFEGINVSSEERVAIKVMLPALAADPNVQEMFRKEARTLTRLSHPALVQYRVLAQEPQLGVLYIVTEYIDGGNLSDVLRTIRPSPAELRAFARRLADGLRVAHALGAIHRDISPDNVLLEDGRLDRAKIIDFGIAKSLDPSAKTIVGDGFAGKLNYVAPEQLGDFKRDVGPWSDVYSLGLVLLAMVLARDVDMGATLVDAVDRRRQGPDISAVPAELRPVLAKMLVANPAQRLRSMDAVIAALDGVPAPGGRTKQPKPPKPRRADTTRPAVDTGKRKPRMRLILGAAAALAIVIGGGVYLFFGSHGAAPREVVDVPPPRIDPPAIRARAAVQSVTATIGCSWLTADRITDQGGSVALVVSGVARDPAAAQGAIARALTGAGLANASINFDAVLPVQTQACVALDTFREIRETDVASLSVQQPKFEMTRQPDGSLLTSTIVNLDIGSESSGFGWYGIEPSGVIEAIPDGDNQPIDTRARFLAMVAANSQAFVKTGATSFRGSLFTGHKGLSGLIVFTGREPFDTKLITTPAKRRDAAWSNRMIEEARRGGWKAQMVWYRTVDEVPG